MDITLRGLLPGRDYTLQARATAGLETSNWSPIFLFRTGEDKVAPYAPSNFKVEISGSTFQASWTKPTLSEDGTNVLDLAGYIIKYHPVGDTTKIISRNITDTKLAIGFWDLFDDFGSFKPNLDFSIYSVDRSGNISTVPATFRAQKPLPGPPTSPAVTTKGDAFIVSWVAPINTDILDYEVVVESGTAKATYYTSATTWELSRGENAAAFAGYKTSVTFHIKTRDSAYQLSATAATVTGSKPKPAAPLNPIFAAVGNSFQASWDAVTKDTAGGDLIDRLGYRVRLINGVDERHFFTTDTKFALSYEDNKSNFGTARGSFTFYVGAVDSVNQVGAEATLTATNSEPPAPTNLKGEPVAEGIRLDWTPSIADDVVQYEVWVAGDATSVGTLNTVIPSGTNFYIYSTVAYTQDHYIYLKAVDQFGTASVASNRVGPFRPESPFTVDTTPPGSSTLTTSTPVRPVTEQAAVTLTWTTPTDTDLAGFQIRYSENTSATRIWQYRDVPDKTATTTTIEGLRSDTPYVFQLRTYDNFSNTQVGWPAEVAGTASKSNIAPAEISTSVSIISGGTLRSADYVSGGTTGWLLQSSGLDILGGSVNARVIKAGELRSTATTTADGTTQPTWSLNLAGNASLNDVRVRGKIVVGTDPAAEAGITNAGVNIASWNFGATGQTGPQWAIKGDGTFDIKSGTGARVELSSSGLVGHNGTITTFNINSAGNAYFDGEVRAGSGNFHGTVSVAGRLEVYGGDAYVIARRSGTGAWVMLDGRSTTDLAINSSTGNFSVNYDGFLVCNGANVTGTVTATAGKIAGFTISGTALFGGTGASRVQMQADAGFWAGADARDSSPFYVRTDGYLQARLGVIGGWTINASSLSGSGTISGGTITGSNITGSTVTGGDIRTAASGQRIQLSANGNDTIYFYDVNGTNTGSIQGASTGTAMFINAPNIATQARILIQGSPVEINLSGSGLSASFGASISLNRNTNCTGTLSQGGTPVSLNNHGHSYPVTSVNGRTGAVSGLSEAHSHPYSDSGHTHNGQLNDNYLVASGFYGRQPGTTTNHNLISASGNPFVWGNAGDLRVACGSTNQVAIRNIANTAWRPCAASSYPVNSSAENKVRVEPADPALAALKKLRPVKYVRSDDPIDTPQRRGFLAEEVNTIAPDVALVMRHPLSDDPNGPIEESMGYEVTAMLAFAIQAIQELSAEVDALKAARPTPA